MNAVYQLPEQHLEETLSRYDIGSLQKYWPAANGIENNNYFVQALSHGRQRDYVLTVLQHEPNAGVHYVAMMSALDDCGLPVAAPIPNLADMAVDEVDGKPAMLQRRLPGKHVYNPTARQVSGLARFIAHMHLAMQDFGVDLPVYPRDVAWLGDNAEQVSQYLPFADRTLLTDSISRIDNLLQRRDVQDLPTGMIHGDLFRDNVLFNESGLTGVLDFHHACHGFWLYDLAVAANDWCCDASGLLDQEKTLAMLRAYNQIRPLTPAELWFFSGFALFAALAFWTSRLIVAVGQVRRGNGRSKNPDEFKQIVQHHLGHPFYLDERLLSDD